MKEREREGGSSNYVFYCKGKLRKQAFIKVERERESNKVIYWTFTKLAF